jgi:hypothetical protein
MPDDEFKFEPEPFEETPPRVVEKEPRITRAAPKKTTVTTPPYREGALVEPITMAYGMFGLGIGTLEFSRGKEHMPIGSAITESAEQCARAWDKAAKTSPAIRRMLYKLVGSSNLIGVSIAHAPIMMAVANEMPATQRLVKGLQTFVERMTYNGPVSQSDDSA